MTSNTPLKERDEWRTPQWLLKFIRSEVINFKIDTACTPVNAVAEPVFSKDHPDALGAMWSQPWICNPPYSDKGPWIDHALNICSPRSSIRVWHRFAAGKTCNAPGVLVLPSPNGEKLYQPLYECALEIVIIGRVSFLRPDGVTLAHGNRAGTSLFVCNSYIDCGRAFVYRDELIEKYGDKC